VDPPYYRFNSVRLSVRQYWQWQGLSTGLLVHLTHKLLRIRVPDVYWPNPSLMEMLGPGPDDSALTPLVTRLVSDAERDGFNLGFYYRMPQLGPVETRAAALLSEDRLTLALCAASRAQQRGAGATRTQIGCVSRVADDGEIATTDARPLIPTPPFVHVVRLPGATSRKVMQVHRDRIAGRALQAFSANPESIRAEIVAAGRRTIAFLVEARLLVPMTPAEATDVQRRREPPPGSRTVP
jgi:hypothetical protein